MPGMIRLTDVDSGGHPSASGSTNVIINNLYAVRSGEMRMCPPPKGPGTNLGVHSVKINNRDVQLGGDPVSSGCMQSQCSSDYNG